MRSHQSAVGSAIRDHCAAASVPFHVKQWGWETAQAKLRAGRLLDEKLWDEFARDLSLRFCGQASVLAVFGRICEPRRLSSN